MLQALGFKKASLPHNGLSEPKCIASSELAPYAFQNRPLQAIKLSTVEDENWTPVDLEITALTFA